MASSNAFVMNRKSDRFNDLEQQYGGAKKKSKHGKKTKTKEPSVWNGTNASIAPDVPVSISISYH